MTVAEEAYYIKHMMYAPSLFQHLALNYHHFDFFIFIPYMFAPTAVGARIVRENASSFLAYIMSATLFKGPTKK